MVGSVRISNVDLQRTYLKCILMNFHPLIKDIPMHHLCFPQFSNAPHSVPPQARQKQIAVEMIGAVRSVTCFQKETCCAVCTGKFRKFNLKKLNLVDFLESVNKEIKKIA